MPVFAAKQSQSFGKELLFEVNESQAAPEGRFLARTGSYQLFLSDDGATFRFRQSAVHLNFIDADAKGAVRGFSESAAKVNYFRGADPKNWRRNVPLFEKVRYSGLYPGVDAVFYGNEGALEYDLVVAPNADPGRIRLQLQSYESPKITKNGDLVVSLPEGELRFHAPKAYQMSDSTRTPIQAAYSISPDHSVSFTIGAYDHAKTLVIDPVLSYSTFLGGSDDEGMFGIKRDSAGNIYLSGETSSIDFPIKNGVQTVEGGDYDAFVSKFDPTGKHLIYSTYLGGSAFDHAVGVAVNGNGEAFVAGVTQSANFPTKNALQSTLKGTANAFVAHLAKCGDELIFSTYFGGSGADGGAEDLTIDAASNVYIAGQMSSPDFPTTAGALQTVCDGPNAFPGICIGDGFVAKISADGKKLLYSTLLGGASYDGIGGIAVDQHGSAFLTGITESRDLPVLNAFQAKLAGYGSAFVSELNPTGSKLIFSTYLGGSQFDSGTAIALGPEGEIWVTGQAGSPDFPLVKAFQSNFVLGDHSFISEFSSNGETLLRSSFFGGSGYDIPFRIGVDAFGSPTVVGFTSSPDLPVTNAIQKTFGGGNADAFAIKILPNSFTPLYATYLGGTGDEFGYAIYQEALGAVWMGGSTSSLTFPVLDSFQSSYAGGPFDAYLSRFSLTIPDYLKIVKDVLGHSAAYPAQMGDADVDHLNEIIANGAYLTPTQLAEKVEQAIAP